MAIIPVNPKYKEVLNLKSFSNLLEIPETIDIVLVFRQSEATLDIVKEVIMLKPKPKIVWMQEGIINEEAAQLALTNGIDVVMDQCMRLNHNRLKEQLD